MKPVLNMVLLCISSIAEPSIKILNLNFKKIIMRTKLLVSTAFLAVSISLSAQKEATITVHIDQGKEIIPKEIYGQFAEHLGSCIYGGLWVGENSEIPHIKRKSSQNGK